MTTMIVGQAYVLMTIVLSAHAQMASMHRLMAIGQFVSVSV